MTPNTRYAVSFDTIDEALAVHVTAPGSEIHELRGRALHPVPWDGDPQPTPPPYTGGEGVLGGIVRLLTANPPQPPAGWSACDAIKMPSPTQN